jgi:hypothetical protein
MDDILEQLFRDDANFATTGEHKTIEIDTFVVSLLKPQAILFQHRTELAEASISRTAM